MEIRAQIAREWIQELQLVSEENALLIRETVASAFAQSGSIPVVTDFSKVGAHWARGTARRGCNPRRGGSPG